ncbi:Phage protein [Streptococcus pneumoniae]|uniref:Phage protein n=1 Tax=Streptococcus pneumoniae TaxID=1313 RepID=A0A4J1XEW7_STREE|nr:Phage protein [Streptococcus pneumoniae]VNP80028.1 Phage protein [Streptococcus pneumoniae]VQX30768.1 Phage protein [Streptococcus pneumoniae]VQX38786.1 Phage protein [Streptococcus pneumoniae]VQZ48614.1 Phage protein [Streptococcus pneumoniae]
MRPKRYPYSGKKESTFVKADPELVEKLLTQIIHTSLN